MTLPIDKHDLQNMNTIIDDLLKPGKFCFEGASWRGTITQAMLKKFVKIKIKNGELSSDKDEVGKVWYFRPGVWE